MEKKGRGIKRVFLLEVAFRFLVKFRHNATTLPSSIFKKMHFDLLGETGRWEIVTNLF